jgi:hypothetical protein
MLAISPDRAILNPLAGVPLGHYAKHAATRTVASKKADRAARRSATNVDRFALQDVARLLVPHERVARCGRYFCVHQSHVELLYSAEEGRAHYACLERCGSVWLCPDCAAKIAEQRRLELAQAVAAVDAAGGQILFLTYTVQHQHGDDLRQLLDKFGLAYRWMTGHRTYREVLRPQYQIFGAVRALETNHGQNGWHPHYHVLLFLSHPLSSDQAAALGASLRALWARAAAKEGLSMNEHGFTLKVTRGAVADYVTKYGRDPQSGPWGVESELAKSHVKRAGNGGATPWALLRRRADGDMQAGQLWRDYADVFKGRQQLVWSPRLRAVLGLEEAETDGDVAAARPKNAVHLLWITLADWLLVLRYTQRGELLDVASAGDVDLIRAFLEGLRGRHLADRRRRGIEPPAPLLPPRQLHFFASL